MRSFVPKDLFDATVEKYEKLLTAANARADQLSASLEKEVNDNKTNMKEFFLRNSAAIQAAGNNILLANYKPIPFIAYNPVL